MPTSVDCKVSETIEVAEQICSEWEQDFLYSLQDQLNRGRTLSEKQLNLLDKLYDKACDLYEHGVDS